MNLHVYEHDIEQDVIDKALKNPVVALDTETTGLDHFSDTLCLIQLKIGEDIYVIKIDESTEYPNLMALIQQRDVIFVGHYILFDIKFIFSRFGVCPQSVKCTKIASKIVHPNLEKHSLQKLLHDELSIEISKTLRTSDWSQSKLTDDQINYAAADVLYLEELLGVLIEEMDDDQIDLYEKACEFLPIKARLDMRHLDQLFEY